MVFFLLMLMVDGLILFQIMLEDLMVTVSTATDSDSDGGVGVDVAVVLGS